MTLPKGTEPLSPARMQDLVLNLTALYDALGDEWVFAGLWLRSDYEYISENVITDGPWVAIATKANNTQLGPVPEARGYGKDMVSALVDLRGIVMEMADQGKGG